MGHYSDLAHTFQGSCPNNDCLMEGDKVCDTPPRDYSLGVSGTYYSDGNSCDTDDAMVSLSNLACSVVLRLRVVLRAFFQERKSLK